MIDWLGDFHKALCAEVGKPTEAFTERRVGKILLRVPSAAHRTPWSEATLNLQAHSILVNVFLNFEKNDLPQAQYERLRTLACVGIGKYWSSGVRIGKAAYAVTVTANHRVKNSIKVDLSISEDEKYARSHNVGILSIDASFKYNKGWAGSQELADVDFMLTSAHEFGHSVLTDFGGIGLSWSHKGSTNPVLQSVKSSTPGYPASGTVDLMKYYDVKKNKPSEPPDTRERAARTNVDPLDLKRLLWLSKLIS